MAGEESKWLNEPKKWKLLDDGVLEVTTDLNSNFWQETYFNFHYNTGHLYGKYIKEDFTYTACIQGDFTKLYDQAGLMIYVDEKHWLFTGVEYLEGQHMIGSISTNGTSDWATGIFPGDPRKFWLRLSKVGKAVCVKYSTDNKTWTLLRLASFPEADSYFVGPMCCSPTREGLFVKFSDMSISKPADDILHSN